MFKRVSAAVLPLVFGLLGACGAAHVQLHVAPTDRQDFRTVEIGTISVTSPEEAAKANQNLQLKLGQWKLHAAHELRRVVERSGSRVAPGPVPPAPIRLSLTSEVRYGNRFLRWFIGFGAGKGSVHSALLATDTRSGRVRFELSPRAICRSVCTVAISTPCFARTSLNYSRSTNTRSRRARERRRTDARRERSVAS